MPPTTAAGRKIMLGRLAASQSSTSAWRRRASSVREATMTLQSSPARRRTMADPTMPLCPATHTVRPRRENVAGMAASVMGLVPLGFARDRLQVALHHIMDELVETDLVAPAEPLMGFAGLTEQQVHFSRSKVPRIDLDDARAGLCIVTLFVGPLAT